MCVRVRSTRVTCAVLRRPKLSPSLVASSSPAAPPPTMTMWCNEGSGTQTRVGLLVTAGLGVAGEDGCVSAVTEVLGLSATVPLRPSSSARLVVFGPAHLSGFAG